MNLTALGHTRAATSNIIALEAQLREAIVEVRTGTSGSGTGILWGSAGLIVTNAHCVSRDAELHVDQGTKRYEAHVVACDPRNDLVLLAASLAGPLLETRDPESLRPGELVFAYGHPLGVRNALAMGILHGVARERRTGRPRWIIADVRLAPGNSGGPLVDAEGRLLGITSMVVNGLGVAVPATVVQRFVESVSSRAA